MVFVCCVYCWLAKSKDRAEVPNNSQDPAAQTHGHAIQRTSTPVAAAIAVPTEHSIDDVPTATATGIRTAETAEALVAMPPVAVGEMEAVPVAQPV